MKCPDVDDFLQIQLVSPFASTLSHCFLGLKWCGNNVDSTSRSELLWDALCIRAQRPKTPFSRSYSYVSFTLAIGLHQRPKTPFSKRDSYVSFTLAIGLHQRPKTPLSEGFICILHSGYWFTSVGKVSFVLFNTLSFSCHYSSFLLSSSSLPSCREV